MLLSKFVQEQILEQVELDLEVIKI